MRSISKTPGPSVSTGGSRVDQADHAVGLHEVAPLLAGLGIDVLGKQAKAVAAGQQFLEKRARFFTAAQRASASTYQKVHTMKAFSGSPKSSFST